MSQFQIVLNKGQGCSGICQYLFSVKKGIDLSVNDQTIPKPMEPRTFLLFFFTIVYNVYDKIM